MVHIDNIPHILKCGFVLATSEDASENYVPIGDPSLIEVRRNYHKEYDLKDYIPFYFGKRTPMLFVIQRGFNNVPRQHAENIVYCAIRLEDVFNSSVDCIFTDGHAVNEITEFYSKEKLSIVDNYVKYNDVDAKYWENTEEDPDRKRRKEAELLVKEKLPPEFIFMFGVYNDNAKRKLINFGIQEDKVAVSPKDYF